MCIVYNIGYNPPLISHTVSVDVKHHERRRSMTDRNREWRLMIECGWVDDCTMSVLDGPVCFRMD